MNNRVNVLISQLRNLNIQIWLENNDCLRYKAPKDVLTPELLAELKQYKPDIISFCKVYNQTH